jgi:hypothetical protein
LTRLIFSEGGTEHGETDSGIARGSAKIRTGSCGGKGGADVSDRGIGAGADSASGLLGKPEHAAIYGKTGAGASECTAKLQHIRKELRQTADDAEAAEREIQQKFGFLFPDKNV